ncbi:MAG: TIGR00730 family Rossman fold protein [Stappiaceae bacterium]
MKSVCVFCGSSIGTDPAFEKMARKLGRTIANDGLRLVYGGARVGLMGAVADAALENGGEVIGVLPEALSAKELAHTGLTELHIVGSMHERKAMMADLSDGFISLPGGIGTLEEIFEVWTWGQLGYHRKPCGFLNVNGFYDKLMDFLDWQVASGFLKQDLRDMVALKTDPKELLTAFENYEPIVVPKWINRTQT